MTSAIETPTPLETLYLHAVPPATRHAITTHMPRWEDVMTFVDNAGIPEFQSRIVSVYPRIFPHRDVKEVRCLASHQKVLGAQTLTREEAQCLHYQEAQPAGYIMCSLPEWRDN